MKGMPWKDGEGASFSPRVRMVLAAGRVFGCDMEIAVNEPHVVVGRDVDAVRVGGECALAPRRDEVAVGVPDRQGMRAPAEDVHLVLRVDRAV